MKNQRLSAKIKFLVITLFTVLMFGTVLLVLGVTKNERFVEYGSKAYDDEIAVNIRETEKRESKYQTGSKEALGEHGKSTYSFRITLIKLKSTTQIKDIRLYFSIKTEAGSYRYDEYSSSTKNMTNQTYTSITTFNNLSSKYFNHIDEDGEHVDYLIDETPIEYFIKITYRLNNESKERVLTYKTESLKFDKTEKNFNKLETREVIKINADVNPQYIDPKDDPVRVRLNKTYATEETALDDVKEDSMKIEFNVSSINLNKLKYDEEKLKEKALKAIELPKVESADNAWDVNPEISDIKFEVWIKTNSDDSELSNYVKAYAIYGYMSSYRALSITSFTIDQKLSITEVYVFVEGKIYNGTKNNFDASYKVAFDKLISA